MENNQNQTNEEVKVGFFKKVGNRIKSVGEKVPAPVKKVAKIGAIVGGTVIATAIFGKYVNVDTNSPDDEIEPEEEKKEEEPF